MPRTDQMQQCRPGPGWPGHGRRAGPPGREV